MDGNRRPQDARKEPRPENCPPGSLTHLIRRTQAGDVAAAHELYGRLEPMVRRAVAPYRPDRELYQNLMGEAYLIVERLARQFDETRGVNPFTYFGRMLPPAVWTAARRERLPARRERSLDDGRAEPSGSEGTESRRPDDAHRRLAERERGGTAPGSGFEEAALVRLTLRKALSRLSERQQDVLALWEAGYASAEMAEILGFSAADCRQTLHRALLRLRRELKNELE